jgi:hypothetical protein
MGLYSRGVDASHHGALPSSGTPKLISTLRLICEGGARAPTWSHERKLSTWEFMFMFFSACSILNCR